MPGNPDPHASIALTVALAAHYRKNPRIAVDLDPSDFFFHWFGQTLIGACHGHKMKPDRMAMAMAVMRREDWGKTRFHHFFFGHIHHETAKEVGDVRVESFQTIAAKDAHVASSGYTSGASPDIDHVSLWARRDRPASREHRPARHMTRTKPPRLWRRLATVPSLACCSKPHAIRWR